MNLDFTSSGSFSSATVTVTATSKAGRDLFSQMFGVGAISVELPKSRWSDFVVFASRKGLKAS